MDASTPLRRRAEPADRSGSFRPEIQGLRALAVLLVALNHLFGWPSGGFVGVDCFYVISGYLITGLLVREVETTGWISFAAFYGRRVRRILPAASVVLIATCAVSLLVWYLPRALQTILDAGAAAFFVANWHFVRTGADYLQAAEPPSPIQHYWSLSIEEQFYILWPWLVLLLVSTARKAGLRTKPSLAVMFLAITVASFLWSVVNTSTSPSAAYFNTFGRCWELTAGALLAVVPPRRLWWPALAAAVTWIGLAVVVASAVLVRPSVAFPGPWALPPVLGAVAVIAGGRPIAALANPMAQYLGKISYSLYLWHFPVIIIGFTLVPRQPYTILLLAGATVLLSHISYEFIEVRFRHRKPAHVPASGPVRRRLDLIPGSALALVIVILALAQLHGPGRAVTAGLLIPAPAADPQPQWQDGVAYRGLLHDALVAKDWPDLRPSLNLIGERAAAPQMAFGSTGCRNSVYTAARNVCEAGDENAGKTAVVVGDSIALSWLPTINSALTARGWRVWGFGFASCPLAAAHDTTVDNVRCDAAKSEMTQFVRTHDPDLVLTSSSTASMTNLSSGRSGAAAGQEWEHGTAEALKRLRAVTTAPVVVLQTPPVGGNPHDCATRLTGPHRCVTSVSSPEMTKVEAETRAATQAGDQVMRTEDWFCVDEKCPAFVDGTLIRFDEGHLTADFANRLGTLFRQRLVTLLARMGPA